jgi:hypothetical protein
MPSNMFIGPRGGKAAFEPLNWYWVAKDGRIYSSAGNRLTWPYDTGYVNFVAQNGGATPWPTDTNGQQTTAALQAVVGQYGITLPFS